MCVLAEQNDKSEDKALDVILSFDQKGVRSHPSQACTYIIFPASSAQQSSIYKQRHWLQCFIDDTFDAAVRSTERMTDGQTDRQVSRYL